jgi:NADH pyrophosphatase NudC (nudix superfamily)
MRHKCPGINPRFWTHKDIGEHRCPECGRPIEFWKDDVKRICPGCQSTVFNPRLGNLCLTWCKKAAECLGNMDIEEWKKQAARMTKPDCPPRNA